MADASLPAFSSLESRAVLLAAARAAWLGFKAFPEIEQASGMLEQVERKHRALRATLRESVEMTTATLMRRGRSYLEINSSLRGVLLQALRRDEVPDTIIDVILADTTVWIARVAESGARRGHSKRRRGRNRSRNRPPGSNDDST